MQEVSYDVPVTYPYTHTQMGEGSFKIHLRETKFVMSFSLRFSMYQSGPTE